jgi:uncharacterized protein with HEPN domain
MSKYNLYLDEILNMINSIELSNFNKKVSYNQFIINRDLMDATNMRLQVIGENLSKLPRKMLANIKEVSVKQFILNRNIVSHAYFAVKPSIVWFLVTEEIPKLKKVIIRLSKKEENLK